MAKVFLTGASGFVGGQILKTLLASGHEVTATARSRNSIPADMTDRIKVIETQDLFSEETEWWQAALSGHDALIHAAWYVEPVIYLNSPLAVHCAWGSAAMVSAAASAGVSHFVGLGTCMEYRLPSAHLGPDAPLGPDNLYAASKLATFFMTKRRAEAASMRFTWCRLFYLYGEGEYEKRLVPYLRKCLEAGEVAQLSAGTQVRDYIDVVDAGRMIASIVDTGQQGVVNICSGQPVTIRAFAEGIADEYGRRDLLEFSANPIPAHDPAAVVGICNWKAPS